MGMKSAVKHTPVPLSEWKKYQDKQAELQRKNTELVKMRATEIKKGKGYEALARNKYELAADVTPPGYEGVRDVKTGKLLSEFTVNPFAGEASSRLRDEALSTGPSTLANLQLQRQQAEEAKMRGSVGLQQQAAQAAAQSNLARTGGLGGGARTSLARSGARDALFAKQGVAGEGVMSRFGINEADMKRRQELLGTTADVERQAGIENINTLKDEVARRGQFDKDRYTGQMAAWGAEKSAEATRAAGGQKSGGGGCCFIFLEARYGDGTMDEVVRKYRDEYMTEQNRRGYYKVSEVLVPLMRKYPIVKGLVRITMTDPLVAYGKAHYGKGTKLGFVFAPLKTFWLKTFEYIGGEHPFLRENGETV